MMSTSAQEVDMTWTHTLWGLESHVVKKNKADIYMTRLIRMSNLEFTMLAIVHAYSEESLHLVRILGQGMGSHALYNESYCRSTRDRVHIWKYHNGLHPKPKHESRPLRPDRGTRIELRLRYAEVAIESLILFRCILGFIEQSCAVSRTLQA